MIHSYLKWVGSKAKLFSEISLYFPGSYNNYYEPFLGSASAYFNIHQFDLFASLKSYYLRDINKHLINCHLIVANDLENLKIELIKKSNEEAKNPDLYNLERQQTVKDFICGKDVKNAARFIYLNKRSYGGMWRENKSGMFNVPKSESQNTSYISDKFFNRLEAHSKILQKASITCGSYDFMNPEEGDFVFLDPPYYPISNSSNFTSYSKEAWGANEHNKLFEYLKKITDNGVRFLMTNNDVEYIRDKSSSYIIEKIVVTRFIDALKYRNGSAKKSRENISELIIRNF